MSNLRVRNVNKLIIGSLNINSISNKFDQLRLLVDGKVDILIITETKLDSTFPSSQFMIKGYSEPYRLDRNRNGGGFLIYIREDIPSKNLISHTLPSDIEGLFIELNLRNSKWLIFGTYHPPSQSDEYFFHQVKLGLDRYSKYYERFILIGDFNAEESEPCLSKFLFEMNAKNIVNAPPYANLFMGRHEETIREAFIWAIPFWKRFIDDIFLIFLGTTEQLQSMKDFMNNLHPTIKFTFEHSTHEISFLDMKILIGTDRKLSTTLYRKPTDCAALLHFHSNHSLKCKESIVFSQALRYNLLITDDTLLQKELDSLAISLLTRQYPLEIITRNISKALLHSRETLLHRPPKTASPKRVLPIITPYSPEGRHFSQSVRNRWHIIENDSELQNVWSNHPITAYHKTKSLKDILVHSRQTKPISSRPVPTKFR